MVKYCFLYFLLTLCTIFSFAQRKVEAKKMLMVGKLSDAVKETSGILYWDGSFWTHNDSSNPPFIFRLDTATGSVKKAIWIKNAYNFDWECIAQDQHFLYVGDTGDNISKRIRKRIYRIAKQQLFDTTVSAVVADTICFEMPYSGGLNSNYDIEAMVCAGGQLHFFTKEADTTRHFSIPAISDHFFTAKYVDKLFLGGRVTDACYDSTGQELYLLTSAHFAQKTVWCIKTSDDILLSGAQEKISIGTVAQYGQLEGICKAPDGVFYLTNEKLQAFSPCLWRWRK